MILYASHAVYCAALALLATHLEARDEAGTHKLCRILWAVLAWSVAHLTAAAVLDAKGTRYSQIALRDAVRVRDLPGVALFLLVIVAQMSLCAAGTFLGRIVWGFPLGFEVATSCIVLTAYDVLNIRYNVASSARLAPFFASKGLDLTAHQRWSYALSNVGLAFRTFKRVIVFAISVAMWPNVPTPAELLPGWSHPWMWLLGLILLLQLPAPCLLYQYQIMHQGLHANVTLYKLVHKVHHCARYPIPSDSGTESPLEFMANGGEVSALKDAMLPWWLALPYELNMMRENRASHTLEVGNVELASGDSEHAAHHMLHHTKNTGNMSFFPSIDRKFGTLIDSTNVSPFVLPPAETAKAAKAA
jgi:sterol desaturase/sphingolipid hydroxylase (fatty acid hydroxylase superfamily)